MRPRIVQIHGDPEGHAVPKDCVLRLIEGYVLDMDDHVGRSAPDGEATEAGLAPIDFSSVGVSTYGETYRRPGLQVESPCSCQPILSNTVPNDTVRKTNW